MKFSCRPRGDPRDDNSRFAIRKLTSFVRLYYSNCGLIKLHVHVNARRFVATAERIREKNSSRRLVRGIKLTVRSRVSAWVIAWLMHVSHLCVISVRVMLCSCLCSIRRFTSLICWLFAELSKLFACLLIVYFRGGGGLNFLF